MVVDDEDFVIDLLGEQAIGQCFDRRAQFRFIMSRYYDRKLHHLNEPQKAQIRNTKRHKKLRKPSLCLLCTCPLPYPTENLAAPASLTSRLSSTAGFGVARSMYSAKSRYRNHARQ